MVFQIIINDILNSMIWPPVKAWTRKVPIDGKAHFVAINYGGELLNKWVVLMSVIDSSLIVKVSWSQIVDSFNWEPGWGEINHIGSSKLADNKDDLKTIDFSDPSIDSGLTIPITKNTIRPWFEKS